MIALTLPDRAATRRLAARIAALARPGDAIALSGPLGAGKSAFARDFIAARAGESREVPSPTFTLVQPYEIGALTVWHFDLYRLSAPEEVVELGFEDALDDGIVLVEWPDRLGWLIPEDRLEIAFAPGSRPCVREVTLAAFGTWRARLAELAAAVPR